MSGVCQSPYGKMSDTETELHSKNTHAGKPGRLTLLILSEFCVRHCFFCSFFLSVVKVQQVETPDL